MFGVALSLSASFAVPSVAAAAPNGVSIPRSPIALSSSFLRDADTKTEIVLGGAAFDLAGDLYLANGGNGATEYAPDQKTVKRVLADTSLPYPNTINVAYDVHTGLTAVLQPTNYGCVPGFPYACMGAVSLYAPNSVTPCATVNAGIMNLVSGAFGARGSLFLVGYGLLAAPQITVIQGGCSAPSVAYLTTGNVLHATGGIAVNRQNQIVIEDPDAAAIYTYENPFKSKAGGALGMPVATTPLGGFAETSAPRATFAFSSLGDAVWVVNPTTGTIDKFRYPAGGKGQSVGLAVYPPEYPKFDY
jgi:hypothetical protein